MGKIKNKEIKKADEKRELTPEEQEVLAKSTAALTILQHFDNKSEKLKSSAELLCSRVKALENIYDEEIINVIYKHMEPDDVEFMRTASTTFPLESVEEFKELFNSVIRDVDKLHVLLSKK